MAVSQARIKRLQPLLVGSGPNSSGWWDAHCPYHHDVKRSAGINIEEGVFRCQGCGEYKTVAQLLKDEPDWMVVSSNGAVKREGKPQPVIDESSIEGWHSALLSNSKRLQALMSRRGLNVGTITRYELGWDEDTKAYTIPVRDSAGNVLNIRRYQLDVPEGRRKIWSVDGLGSPTLYPVDQLDHGAIVICEGEMDALLTIQNGIPAITRTGAADVWREEWSHAFKGKSVYPCHDMDTKGQAGNRRVESALRFYARKITTILLPFELDDKHGKDLTDYWLAGNLREDFIGLIKESRSLEPVDDDEDDGAEPEMVPISIMDSFDAALVERPLSMAVTIVGKKYPSFLIPKEITFVCEDVGSIPKCKHCAIADGHGVVKAQVAPQDPVILKLINVPEDRMAEVLGKDLGIPKCARPRHRVGSYRAVEEVYIRPSIEEGPTNADQDFTHRQVVLCATHDLKPNESVVVTGTIRPHPKTQANEFQAWAVKRAEKGLDRFEASPEIIAQMKQFQTDDPAAMLAAIAADQAANYTRIVGRETFHTFADIIFHSILDVPFPGYKTEKGWLDGIAIGDTRTGKSAVATAMIDLYGAGELISCEAASFAGVVGGLDRLGDGSWVIRWGSIPVNDRRLVALDEVSGLTTEQISQMSDMRSSGVAKLTKIKSESAMARTRLLWMANPRGTTMDSVAYGIDALKTLIGNPEDIARFDMAMGVFSADVDSSEINEFRPKSKTNLFTKEAYRAVLKWAWTRKSGDLVWGKGSVGLALKKATQLGHLYMETPPLIQGANVRMKIARIAAAIAARTYSTTNGQNVMLLPIHIEAAVDFLNKIYSHTGFGYKVVSQQRALDRKATEESIPKIMEYLAQRPGLNRFLQYSPTFNRFQMESLLNTSNEEAQTIINSLWSMKAIEMFGNQIRVAPVVLAALRGTLIS